MSSKKEVDDIVAGLFEDGDGPGGIAGYLRRRSSRKMKQAGTDALYGLGAAGAGAALAPATGGFSYVPGYGVAGLNFGRALSGVGDSVLHALSADRFSKMPEGPPELSEDELRQLRMLKQGRK